jgi:hypothetical protein
MPSSPEQICARIAAVLTGATAAGARVYRDREDAFTREESPAIVVECIDEDTQAQGGGAHPGLPLLQSERSSLRVAVTVAVRSAGWQTVADAVRVQTHALLMADPTLRALHAGMARDRCEWKAASADLPFGYVAQIYRFTYLNRAHALDLPA